MHLFSFSQAADLDGEIDLSTCFDVTEYSVQRNYGFQIHVRNSQTIHRKGRYLLNKDLEPIPGAKELWMMRQEVI